MMILNREVISKLRREYGDAFYLLDSEQYRKNFIELRDTFRKIYPNFNIAYSYKTNYTPKFCKIVNELEGYAEVVSEMELEIAQRVGVKPDRIIWNGPIKNPQKLEEFLVTGGTDNIDSIEELAMVKTIAERHSDKMLNLGIRCNYEVGDGVVSRFGFDVESDDFRKVLEFVTMTKNVHFINFQCHFAKRQIEYWPARAKGMMQLVDRLGIIPERIDIGGGLFGKMADSLKAQFTNEIPGYQAYAEAAAAIFADYFADKDVKPELLIEPGSAVVGDCMKFVGTVKSIKSVRGKSFATVLGSQKNISMSGINPPMEVIAMGGEQKEYENLDMVGFTCIEGDVLYHGYKGKLAHEDAIVISNCGSYSLVMKPPFILPNFPVLDISTGQTEVIKRGEVFDDLFHTFNF
jgi:diaminopimelate decarboxylase